jgi:DNA transformation protein
MKDHSFQDFVRDQLRELRGLESRAMFGGFGLYAGGKIFGILFKGRLYLKTSAATRPAYVQRGMESFRPNAKQRLNAYYEVPADILEDAPQLEAWSRTAVQEGGK